MGVLIFGALVHANTVISSERLFHSKFCNPAGLGLNTSHWHYRAMWDLLELPTAGDRAHELQPAWDTWEREMEARGAHYVFQAHRLRSQNLLFPYEQVISAVQRFLFPKDFGLRMQQDQHLNWEHEIPWIEAVDCIREFYDDHLIEMRAQCRNVTHIAILP